MPTTCEMYTSHLYHKNYWKT
uniref:Uncharacterized protein n=1 Tax=Arundo donax TaxID=35708 RepID=A0A0A8ZQS7_ARUDO